MSGKPTVKQHLAVFCILTVNPAHGVRGPKHVVKRSKTPVLDTEQARATREHRSPMRGQRNSDPKRQPSLRGAA